MKLIKTFVAGLALASVAALALVAQQTGTPGAHMVAAAQKFLGGLSDDQKTQATFAFDDKERFNWNFVPLQDKERKTTRKGLPLEAMSPAQKKAALDLVRAGTSEQGHVAAVTIMSLEAILAEQETKGAMVRNPEWYFFSVFGAPSKTGKWGWRVEGHHLSLNFTMDGDQVVASTPTFFGANPAEIKMGAKKGFRTLAAAEDLAKELFESLDEDQRKVAHQSKHFPEPGQKTLKPNLGPPVGLNAAKLFDKQRNTLFGLVKSYTQRMPPAIGAEEYKAAWDAGLEKVHIAFSGDTTPGKGGFTYRIHGPTFVIEFLNIQSDAAGNKANHIHSAWRRIEGDFGVN